MTDRPSANRIRSGQIAYKGKPLLIAADRKEQEVSSPMRNPQVKAEVREQVKKTAAPAEAPPSSAGHKGGREAAAKRRQVAISRLAPAAGGRKRSRPSGRSRKSAASGGSRGRPAGKRRSAAAAKTPGSKRQPVLSAGLSAGRAASPAGGVREKRIQASRSWAEWWSSRAKKGSWREYAALARSFLRGYSRSSGRHLAGMLPLPTVKSVSAVISAPGARGSLLSVLDQLGRLPFHEIIVILSGPAEGIWQLVGAHSSLPTVVHYDEPLSADAGRAIGAKLASSDIVLFASGERPVRAEELLPFIHSVAKGSDLALNQTAARLESFGSREPFAIVKEFVNTVQGRRDLGTASLSAYPHAVSRSAIERLGPARLAVPPVAQALAASMGLTVTAIAGVRTAGRRAVQAAAPDPAFKETSLGDFMEAIHEQTSLAGPRSGYPDQIRRREKVKEAVP